MTGDRRKLEWFSPGGGPSILLENRLLNYWRGSFEAARNQQAARSFDIPNKTKPVTDYDRACGVDDIIGIIGVGPGHGVILGDAPTDTAWWPLPDLAGGILVRWRWANDESGVLNALSQLKTVEWESTDLDLHIAIGNLFLFDAASPGNEMVSSLPIRVNSGRYAISNALYQPDPETSLILHKLSPRRSS